LSARDAHSQEEPEPASPAPAVPRSLLLRTAVRLEVFTLTYNVFEGIVAIAAGWIAGSIALLGFGYDSAIETASAWMVLRRLRAECRGGGAEVHERAERRAQRFVGFTLFALCAYVAYESVLTLVERRAADPSAVGVGLAALSLLVMPALAVAKRRTGIALHSRALVADASETFACAYLSFTLLLGLLLNATVGWWWADPAAALVMVPWIFREAREAWEGEDTD
jgi:divalent metal cation (Fe/Co/Zn/Cd) transporter